MNFRHASRFFLIVFSLTTLPADAPAWAGETKPDRQTSAPAEQTATDDDVAAVKSAASGHNLAVPAGGILTLQTVLGAGPPTQPKKPLMSAGNEQGEGNHNEND